MIDPKPAGASARLLDPLAALGASIERLDVEMLASAQPLDRERRERLELAAADVLRALVRARRAVRELETRGLAALDHAMLALGSVSFVMKVRAPAPDATPPASGSRGEGR